MSDLVTPVVYGTLPGGMTRTRFFNGMYLSQAHFENEQQYWRLKRQLTNRALGHGVVWGLRLTYNEGSDRLTLHPGYAIDCCGNDLVICAASQVLISDLFKNCEVAQQLKALAKQKRGVPACLMLEYAECPSDPLPVHNDACKPDSTFCEPSRVRETARLRLVPKPAKEPGPLQLFAEEVNELKQQMPALFPDEPQPTTQGLPLALHVRISGGDEVVSRALGEEVILRPDVQSGKFTAQAKWEFEGPVDRPLERLDFVFELRADNGWVLATGEVATALDGVSTPITQLQAPYALHLTWKASAVRGEGRTDYTVQPWSVVRLFSSDDGLASRQTQLAHRVAWEHAADGRLELEMELSWEGTFETFKHHLPPDETSCLRALVAGGLCQGQTPQAQALAPRTLLLAAVFAWLWNALRELPGAVATNGPDPEVSGPRLLGTWLYTYAWRALFGADAANPDAKPEERARLGQILHVLFQRWCAGYHYPGPRCEPGWHGVLLGCVEVTSQGITRLDPIECRRHVITGPLLQHWGKQFGLAPIDLVANRLFRAICCISGLNSFFDLPPVPEAQVDSFDMREAQVTSELFGHAATMLTDSAFLLYGSPAETLARLEALGIPVVQRSEQGLAGFMGTLLATLSKPGPLKAPSARRSTQVYALYALGGSDQVTPHLLVAVGQLPEHADERPQPVGPEEPAEPEVPAEPARPVVPERLIEAGFRDAELRPFARASLAAFTVALAREVPTAGLFAGDAAEEARVAKALEKAGFVTIADMVGTDPELLLASVNESASADSDPVASALVLETALTLASDSVIQYARAAVASLPDQATPFDRAAVDTEDFITAFHRAATRGDLKSAAPPTKKMVRQAARSLQA